MVCETGAVCPFEAEHSILLICKMFYFSRLKFYDNTMKELIEKNQHRV